MQGLLRQFIACDYCILNFVLFSSNFQILCPFFNISLPFFWNIAPMPLLSRIGPAYDLSTSEKNADRFNSISNFDAKTPCSKQMQRKTANHKIQL